MIEGLIRKHLRNVSARRILDVGPGYSNFSRVAAEVTGATEITFLDVDDAVLSHQLKESQRAGVKAIAVTVRLDEHDLATLQGPFDLIHCQEVLEHLPNAPAVLESLSRKLSREGRIIVTVPTKVSERWLRFLNPGYMKDQPFGHVNEYAQNELLALLESVGLVPLVFIPTQPHYFVAHTWFYGSRMKSEPSTGKVLTSGFRSSVFSVLQRGSRWLFAHTGAGFWGRMFPRNFFVVAQRVDRSRNS